MMLPRIESWILVERVKFLSLRKFKHQYFKLIIRNSECKTNTNCGLYITHSLQFVTLKGKLVHATPSPVQHTLSQLF